jgi:hypothetical protein
MCDLTCIKGLQNLSEFKNYSHYGQVSRDPGKMPTSCTERPVLRKSMVPGAADSFCPPEPRVHVLDQRAMQGLGETVRGWSGCTDCCAPLLAQLGI